MKYRIIQCYGFLKVQYKYKYWPFWFLLTYILSSDDILDDISFEDRLKCAKYNIEKDKEKRNFKKTVIYEENE